MARNLPLVFLALAFALVVCLFVEAQENVEDEKIKKDPEINGELKTITYGDSGTSAGVLETFGLLLSTFNVTQNIPGIKHNGKAEDDCDLYGRIIANKLRKYPESMRARVIYKIDGLLLNNPYPEPSTTPVPTTPISTDQN